jgi:ADP-heptose:LPS heptosyltransferase
MRRRWPRAEIVVLTSEAAAAVFHGWQDIDRAVVSRLYYRSGARMAMRVGKVVELARLVWTVGVGYDLVVTYWWGTTLLHLLGALAAPRGRRIGYARGLPALLTSDLGSFVADGDYLVAHDRLLDAAGVTPPTVRAPQLQITDADATSITALLGEHGLLDRRYVVVHPGADWACQQWLPERWAEVCDELVERYGVTPVFTGVEGERRHIDAIRARMYRSSVSLAGQTTLGQLAALLARASLCVCVDSAVFEVTQALGVPAVVLAGPSRAEQLAVGSRPPQVIKRMEPAMQAAINRCREPRFAAGGCLDYSCPLAGLREIPVPAVLDAVARELAPGDERGARAELETIPSGVR